MVLLATESAPAEDIVRQFDRIWRIALALELADEAFVNKCSGCCTQRAMSSIPQGAFAAAKVHLNMESGDEVWRQCSTTSMQHKMNTREKATSWPSFPKINQQFIDHPLAKYNSKLMNSIWGLYNRYSVHNFKRVTEEEVKGRAGEWAAQTSFAFNKATQPNQPNSAAPGVGPAPALPSASVPIRDANPLNTLWIGGHAH